jgi:hypothetical protein
MIAPIALAIGMLLQPAYSVAPSGGAPAKGFLAETTERSDLMMSARRAVTTLVARGKLESNWSSKEPEWPVRQRRGGQEQWVVAFRDPAIVDPEQRALYITLSGAGEFIEASHRLH